MDIQLLQKHHKKMSWKSANVGVDQTTAWNMWSICTTTDQHQGKQLVNKENVATAWHLYDFNHESNRKQLVPFLKDMETEQQSTAMLAA